MTLENCVVIAVLVFVAVLCFVRKEGEPWN